MIKKIITGLLSCILILSIVPLLSSAETAFIFSGRGYGHGLGLSQYGAKGFASKGYNFQQILTNYYKNTQLVKVKDQNVRILISSTKKTIEFSANKDFTAFSEITKKKYKFHGLNRYRAGINNNRLLIRNLNNGKITGKYNIPLVLSGGAGLKLISQDDSGLSGNVYRGKLRILNVDQKLKVVNHLNSEHYLFGVITKEMPASWPSEALKSQAVAARSYALKNINEKNYFDLYTTTLSQVYAGLGAETVQSIKAVKDTSRLALFSKGMVIEAYYHSSSGGQTENNENVWNSTPIEWLRASSSPYEDNQAIWTSNPSFSSSFLEQRLGVYGQSNLNGVNGKLQGIQIIKRGASPRVITVKIIGSNGETFITGNKLRRILRLKSTWFYVNGK